MNKNNLDQTIYTKLDVAILNQVDNQIVTLSITDSDSDTEIVRLDLTPEALGMLLIGYHQEVKGRISISPNIGMKLDSMDYTVLSSGIPPEQLKPGLGQRRKLIQLLKQIALDNNPGYTMAHVPFSQINHTLFSAHADTIGGYVVTLSRHVPKGPND